jgi:hypothetical protein
LKQAGFTNYRYHSHYHLGLPEKDENGLWRIPGGVQWEKPNGWPVDAWINVLKCCLNRALETDTVLHLWFHPSCAPVIMTHVFPAVLETISRLRDFLWIGTMADICQFMEGQKTKKES